MRRRQIRAARYPTKEEHAFSFTAMCVCREQQRRRRPMLLLRRAFSYAGPPPFKPRSPLPSQHTKNYKNSSSVPAPLFQTPLFPCVAATTATVGRHNRSHARKYA